MISMFREILYKLIENKEDYLNLSSEVVNTPLEKSIDTIINQINLDIEKFLKLITI